MLLTYKVLPDGLTEMGPVSVLSEMLEATTKEPLAAIVSVSSVGLARLVPPTVNRNCALGSAATLKPPPGNGEPETAVSDASLLIAQAEVVLALLLLT